MSALGDARVVTRAEVEALLALVEQVHSPNNGTIAQLCRTWLAVDAAPIGRVPRGKVGDMIFMPLSFDFAGKRVRLVGVE